MKYWFLVVLVGATAVGSAAFALAQTTRTVEVQTTASVEVRVWRNIADPSRLHLSTRPAGGAWTTHNTRLDLSETHHTGRWHVSSFVTVDVPITVSVEVEEPAPSRTTSTGEPEWCDDRPSWSGAAVALLQGATGFYSLDPVGNSGHRDHVLPWSVLCLLVDTEAEARTAYNDTTNLVPSLASFNLSKGDDLADEWLPRWQERDADGYSANACDYADRYSEVARRYGHALGTAERSALDAACAWRLDLRQLHADRDSDDAGGTNLRLLRSGGRSGRASPAGLQPGPVPRRWKGIPRVHGSQRARWRQRWGCLRGVAGGPQPAACSSPASRAARSTRKMVRRESPKRAASSPTERSCSRASRTIVASRPVRSIAGAPPGSS